MTAKKTKPTNGHKPKEIRSLADLTPDPANLNKGTQRGLRALDVSVGKYGVGRGIVADKHGRIIGGNKTVERLADLGLTKIRAVHTTGDTLLVNVRDDLDLTSKTDRRARGLAVADNRVGELDYDPDTEAMAQLIESERELMQDFYFDSELEAILKEAGRDVELLDAEPQIDRAEELRKKWGVETGQLWILPSRTAGNDHRLICGDCTDRVVVERVMGVDACNMVLTDPPYGVGYEYNQHRDDPDKYEVLANGFFYVLPKHNLLVLTVGHKWNNFWFSKKPSGFLVWFDKTKQSPSNIAHLCKSELILIFGKVYERFAWDTLEIQQPRNDGLRELHSCPKPLELWMKIIDTQKGADVIYDPFLGSGTTLIACENLSRRCRAIEISPGYCAVILQRYQETFGITPILEQDNAKVKAR